MWNHFLATLKISRQGNNEAAKDFAEKAASTFFRVNDANLNSIQPDNLYR